jgi:plasmid stability protein
MATLYVENVPDSLYEALRERARQHRKSIAAEVMSLLEENIVTADERKARRQFLRRAQSLRSRRPRSAGSFSPSEELQREDRSR